MKKVFLSLALLSASAFSIMAQSNCQQTTDKGQCPNKEQVGKFNPDGKDRDSKAFEGLNLTDDQKAKLAALKQSNCTAKDGKKEKVAPKDGEQKEKLTKEQMDQKRKERAEKHQNARKEYLVQVQEILTPDQYVAFLENCYTLQDNAPKGGQMAKGGFDKKGGPRDMKDGRGQKGQKGQKGQRGQNVETTVQAQNND